MRPGSRRWCLSEWRVFAALGLLWAALKSENLFVGRIHSVVGHFAGPNLLTAQPTPWTGNPNLDLVADREGCADKSLVLAQPGQFAQPRIVAQLYVTDQASHKSVHQKIRPAGPRRAVSVLPPASRRPECSTIFQRQIRRHRLSSAKREKFRRRASSFMSSSPNYTPSHF